MKSYVSSLVLIASICGITYLMGCNKYEEGPSNFLKNKTKVLSGKYLFTSRIKNNQEIPSNFRLQSYPGVYCSPPYYVTYIFNQNFKFEIEFTEHNEFYLYNYNWGVDSTCCYQGCSVDSFNVTQIDTGRWEWEGQKTALRLSLDSTTALFNTEARNSDISSIYYVIKLSNDEIKLESNDLDVKATLKSL